ncbi:50S ribosomal protein L33 [Salirhabdus salicampi]|nr:50S ribosomal protein L33 [Salirhabdus salicampi]MCP8618062.1 50S ribosomal protein L33 [Salirhabdus salicampi]
MSEKIILACDECHSRNYSTYKRKQDERLVVRKYCKHCGKHTLHRETK